MSLSFGALGILSLNNPFFSWSLQTKSEIRSFACLLVFVAVLFILAYLTNPSETTFRAYLTEQSFRHHLSRLDDATDDVEDPDSIQSSSNRRPLISNISSQERTTLPFHFANRASVSLRTPKHVFHTFGICTIATTQGAASPPAGRNSSHTSHIDQDGSVVSDSWYIGAFGRWWRGGLIESWYRDAIIRSKDAEGWSSGILGFKALDKLNDCNRLPFVKSTSTPRVSLRGSPPKLRNRERSSQRVGIFPRRNSTPPPLPKSVSLPLHTDHRQLDSTKQPVSLGHAPSHSQPTLCAADHARLGLPAPVAISRSSSHAHLDHSPIIAEVLRQIAVAKGTATELQSQLGEAHAGAAQSRAVLQSEVDMLRERKRSEDASRVDIKARTRSLDDARRGAEAARRDAEKRLKAARGAREGAIKRMEQLGVEIERLCDTIKSDRVTVAEAKEEAEGQEREIGEVLEEKKREIKVAEDVIAALSSRARDLEERIAGERERFKEMKERADSRKRERSLHSLNISAHNDLGSWSSTSYNPFDLPSDAPAERTEVTSSKGPEHNGTVMESKDVTHSGDLSRSPRPMHLSLGALSNFSPKTLEDTVQGFTERRAKGYTIFDEDIASFAHSHGSQVSTRPSGRNQTQVNAPAHTRPTFSPFEDSDSLCPGLPAHAPGISPMSSNFIQSSLISVMDSTSEPNTGVVSRSFQSESDAIMDRNWRSLRLGAQDEYAGGGTYTSSPVSITGHSSAFSEYDHEQESDRDHFIVCTPSHEQEHAPLMGVPYRTHSDPTVTASHGQDMSPDSRAAESVPRRWFTTKEKPKKGLNPDAKVFRLPRRKISDQLPAAMAIAAKSPPLSYDVLNPTGLISTTSSSSTPSSLLRAFAPSPAEREVLHRALGGSTNTSLERLPSLSDVGSIPSSPVLVHAPAHSHSHSHALGSSTGISNGLVNAHSHARSGGTIVVPPIPSGAGDFGRGVLPSWLQALPMMRKTNFSPWDDEEDDSSEGSLEKRK